MGADAAAVHVWGMSSTSFLIGYGIASVAVVLSALACIARALRTPNNPESHLLTPQELGYLCGGRRRAVLVTLTWLRTTGAIDARNRRLLNAGECPPTATELDRAVYLAANRDIPVQRIRFDRGVDRAIQAMHRRLEGLRLATTSTPRRGLLVGALALVALGTTGYLVSLSGGGDQDPRLIATAAALGLVTVAIARPLIRPATAAGRSQLHRDDYRSAATHPDRLYAAAMQVALSGRAALRVIDSAFAKRAGLLRRPPSYRPRRRLRAALRHGGYGSSFSTGHHRSGAVGGTTDGSYDASSGDGC